MLSDIVTFQIPVVRLEVPDGAVTAEGPHLDFLHLRNSEVVEAPEDKPVRQDPCVPAPQPEIGCHDLEARREDRLGLAREIAGLVLQLGK